MNYEVVYLEKKIIVGVSDITNNEDPKMADTIQKLWKNLFQNGIYQSIQNKINTRAIGLYSDYNNRGYSVTAGCEVSIAENENLTIKVIPAGTYAKFSVYGQMQSAVAKAWGDIWAMDLNRSFTGDFEEYINNDMEHADADIDLYIAINSPEC